VVNKDFQLHESMEMTLNVITDVIPCFVLSSLLCIVLFIHVAVKSIGILILPLLK